MTYVPYMEDPMIGWFSESRSGQENDLFQALLNQPASTHSAMDWSPLIAARLEDIRKECSNPNWDGEDAQVITSDVIVLVESVVRSFNIALPGNIPAPDIIPENDGEVCLSWDLPDGRSFSISIGAHGKMNYAGQLGKKGVVHGWLPINVTDFRSHQEDIEEVVHQIVKLYK